MQKNSKLQFEKNLKKVEFEPLIKDYLKEKFAKQKNRFFKNKLSKFVFAPKFQSKKLKREKENLKVNELIELFEEQNNGQD